MLLQIYEKEKNDTIKIGMFFGLSIFSLSFSFFIYRKLKLKNTTNENIEENQHQISKNFTMATTARRSNPLMRFITSLTGTGTGTSYAVRPSTADAGSQVCDDIITKREKRSRLPSEIEGDQAPREGFIQEMFEASSSCCGATQVDPPVSDTYTCAVCLEELSLGDTNMATTGCGHTFHLTCLLKSLVQKNLCPMCRAPLEDVREKQMPANTLTPVSAEQLIAEEISYFSNAAHVQSITSSRHPRRCFKEALRVFGFTLLRTVAEYIHDTNIPDGWYDDGESDDGSESSEGDNDNDNEDADNQDDDQSDDQSGDQNGDQSEEEQYDDDNGNRSDDEFNYAVRRVARVRDLRDLIGG